MRCVRTASNAFRRSIVSIDIIYVTVSCHKPSQTSALKPRLLVIRFTWTLTVE